MKDNLIRVVSLFCGCGGGDLGLIGGFKFNNKEYESLPYDIVFANDIDKKAVNTYKHNFKHAAMCEDVRNIVTNEIPDHDLLLGGFPCQSFSTVNPTKDPFDERGNLYIEMAKVLNIKQPKVFIAENVKGFMTLYNGEIFRKACSAFEREGYRLFCRLINAANYGVPQKRERVIIVGVRKDIETDFTFPQEIYSQLEEIGKIPWVPLKDVIDSLIPNNLKYYFSDKAVDGMKKAKNNMKRGLHQSLEEPCLTITSHLAKVSLNSRDPVLLVDRERELYRRFTPLEAARIQSFPDSFEFVGTEADAYRQIGNAIPPVVMWYISKNIANQLFSEQYRNDKPIFEVVNVKDKQIC
ncbi:MAG: DNA cytosine methyltransferase [Ruminiclostridium sp.]